MYINRRVIYIGSKNQWTFDKDLLLGFRAETTEVIKTSGTINYMVEFENGLHVSIDHKDLRFID